MDIRKVTWSNPNKLHQKWQGSQDFLVKDAFDDSDAILRVKKCISKPELLEGSTFTVNRVAFTEFGVSPL